MMHDKIFSRLGYGSIAMSAILSVGFIFVSKLGYLISKFSFTNFKNLAA